MDLNDLNLYQTKHIGIINLCLTVLTKTKLWQEKHIFYEQMTKNFTYIT